MGRRSSTKASLRKDMNLRIVVPTGSALTEKRHSARHRAVTAAPALDVKDTQRGCCATPATSFCQDRERVRGIPGSTEGRRTPCSSRRASHDTERAKPPPCSGAEDHIDRYFEHVAREGRATLPRLRSLRGGHGATPSTIRPASRVEIGGQTDGFPGTGVVWTSSATRARKQRGRRGSAADGVAWFMSITDARPDD